MFTNMKLIQPKNLYHLRINLRIVIVIQIADWILHKPHETYHGIHLALLYDTPIVSIGYGLAGV